MWCAEDLSRRWPRPFTVCLARPAFGIVGWPDDEARSLLDELAAHATQAKYQLAFHYGVGDVVVWDNAALLHSATLIDPADARTLWRITVLEESAQAAAPSVLAPTYAD